MQTKATILASQVHPQLYCKAEHEVVRLRFEAVFRGNRLAQCESACQVRVLQDGDEDARDRVREEFRDLVRGRDGDAVRGRALLQGLEDAGPPESPSSSVRGLEEDFLEADLLGPDERRCFPHERKLGEGPEFHGRRELRRRIKGLGGGLRNGMWE